MKIFAFTGMLFVSMLAHGGEPPSTVVRYCSGCHEVNGHAEVPYVPRLAGQRQAYLIERLDEFRHTPKPPVDEILHKHRRSDTSMVGITHALSTGQLSEAARWYASQEPTSVGITGAERGRELYTSGLRSDRIPACASCHGTGTAPIIAGQHASYLLEQLELFRRGLRSNPSMRAIACKLTPSDAKAVAAYSEGSIGKSP